MCEREMLCKRCVCESESVWLLWRIGFEIVFFFSLFFSAPGLLVKFFRKALSFYLREGLKFLIKGLEFLPPPNLLSSEGWPYRIKSETELTDNYKIRNGTNR